MNKTQEKKLYRTLQNKLLANWSKRVRITGVCAICGRTDHLQAHHILPKEYYRTLKFDLNNGIPLCPTCHKYGALSAHRNPIYFSDWLLRNNPEQHQFVLENVARYTEVQFEFEVLDNLAKSWGVTYRVPK